MSVIGGGSPAECAEIAPPRVGFEAPKRVVLVTIDTLRADHLPFYGYPRETAPFLADIAARSAVFERALIACSHTSPAHTSLFTGLHHPQHRVEFNGQTGLDASLRTLAQLYRDAGHETAGFVSVPWLRLLERGFDTFESVPTRRSPEGRARYAPATDTVDRVIAWLDQLPDDARFFLWVHLYDPHRPYQAPEPFVKRMQPGPQERLSLMRHWTRVQGKPLPENARVANRQSADDAEIAYADAELARLYDVARRRGWLEDSLWIFTADHGEGMGNHAFQGHGRFIYQEQLRVPLLVHHPDGGLGTGRIVAPAHHTDLFPTLAEMLEVDPAQAVKLYGTSLLPLLTGATLELPARPFFSQRRKKRPEAKKPWKKGPIYALQDERFKYIHRSADPDEFYDLEIDPLETNNLASTSNPLAEAWRVRTMKTFEQLSLEGAGVIAPETSREDEEALRALGYVE